MRNKKSVIFPILLFSLCLYQNSIGQKNYLKDTDNNQKQIVDDIQARSVDSSINLDYGNIPLYFIPNKGQVHDKVQYLAKTSRYSLWITKEGLVFDSAIRTNKKTDSDDLSLKNNIDSENIRYERDVSRLIYLNANKNPDIVPLGLTEHKANYYNGSDPTKWKTNIQSSKAVMYKELYKNIDLKIYGFERQIEYDWIVKLGANPEDIKFEYKNVINTRIGEEGNLIIKTKFGELVHKNPFGYQIINQKKKRIEVSFSQQEKNIYGFKVKNYNEDYVLIIDPLIYSLSFGGGTDRPYGMTIDHLGNVYVTGETRSNDFPISVGAYNENFNGGYSDAFITKINVLGTDLVYSTYLGGSDRDTAKKITVDENGVVNCAGRTYSNDFPTTFGAYDTTFNGETDVFVIKLDYSGTTLLYSTFIGGNRGDACGGLAVDNEANTFVTGLTASIDFPITHDGYDTSYSGGNDAFIIKLNPTGTNLIYSSFLGGSSSDSGNGIYVDNANIYVSGYTFSSDFPITYGAFDTTYCGGSHRGDVFISKFDSLGSDLIYSTYLGGCGDDYGKLALVDEAGNAFVVGGTDSSDFPTTSGAFDTSYNGYDDGFITKLNSMGTGLIFSTFLGGSENDSVQDLVLDNSGYIYAAGNTISDNFPITFGAYIINRQLGFAGYAHSFITKLNSNGKEILYSSYVAFDIKGQAGMGNDGNNYIYLVGGGRVKSQKFFLEYLPKISGYIKKSDGVDVNNVNLELLPEIYSITTGLDNNYTTTVGHGWSGSITPLKTGYTFSPSMRNYSNVISNLQDQNFTAIPIIPIIAGSIQNNSDEGIGGVSLEYSGGGSLTTDSNGEYSLQVEYGWSGTITPTKTGYNFSPQQRSYNNVISNQIGKNYVNYANETSGILNPSMEDGNQFPNNWETYSNEKTKESGWIFGLAHSGFRSIKIVNSTGASAGWKGSEASFSASYPKNLKFGGWSKAEGVADGGLYALDFRIDFEDGTYTWYYDGLRFDAGTHGWEEASATVSFDKGVTKVRPFFLLYGTTGAAWFDDVYVERAYIDTGILNPGFEDGTTCPDHWWTYNNELSRDSGWVNGGAHGGSRSVKIENNMGANAGWRGKTVNFSNDYPTTLKFGGWAKAENVGTDGLFAIDFRVDFEDGTYTWHYTGLEFSRGTHGWENKETTVTFDKSVKMIRPYLLFYGTTGNVWFDDIYAEETTPVTTTGIYNAGIETGGANPDNWWTYNNDLSRQSGWIDGVSHGGDKSIKIINSTSANAGWHGKTVEYTSPYPRSLKFGGWSKAENIAEGGIFAIDFYIEFEDGTIAWYYDGLRFSHGSHDWERVERTLSYSKGIKKIRPYCLLYGTTGTAWFDDLYATEASTDNAVFNPGVEDGNTTPSDWWTYNNDLTRQSGWIDGVSHGGRRSVKIENTTSVRAGWHGKVYEYSAPCPTSLTLGGWAKAENVANGGIFAVDFKIVFEDDTYIWYYDALRFTDGTHDWENVEETVAFNKGIKEICPYLLLYSTTGTVWFDDIYVNK